jgi:hypothetical protein
MEGGMTVATQRRETSKPQTPPLFSYHFDLSTHVPWCTTAHAWAPLCHDVTEEANRPPRSCAKRPIANTTCVELRKPTLGLILRRARGHKRDRGRKDMGPHGSNRWCRATRSSLSMTESSALKVSQVDPLWGKTSLPLAIVEVVGD